MSSDYFYLEYKKEAIKTGDSLDPLVQKQLRMWMKKQTHKQTKNKKTPIQDPTKNTRADKHPTNTSTYKPLAREPPPPYATPQLNPSPI